jgi:uracil-DNA glycosylase
MGGAIETAADWIPERGDLDAVRQAAAGCRACPLWSGTNGTVFGEGPADARWMLVGEIPGDQEDRQLRPFVGPAGRFLDRCLEEVGLDRSSGWLTNAVKHFKYRMSGKRRLHDRPRNLEIVACRPWVLREIALVRPRVLVALGATAARSLLGPGFRVTRQRGELVASDLAPFVFATIHPSALLRARAIPGRDSDAERARFVADLARIPEILSSLDR